IAIAPSADKQERLVAGGLVWFDDGEPVLPGGPVHFGGGSPGLRSQLEHISLVALASNRVGQLPGVTRIRLCDVAVESGLLPAGVSVNQGEHHDEKNRMS